MEMEGVIGEQVVTSSGRKEMEEMQNTCVYGKEMRTNLVKRAEIELKLFGRRMWDALDKVLRTNIL